MACFLCSESAVAQHEHHQFCIDKCAVLVDPITNPTVTGQDQPAVVLDGRQPDVIRRVVFEMEAVRYVGNARYIQRCAQFSAPGASVDEQDGSVWCREGKGCSGSQEASGREPLSKTQGLVDLGFGNVVVLCHLGDRVASHESIADDRCHDACV